MAAHTAVQFPGTQAAVSDARQYVRDMLADRSVNLDDAALLTSEVVTNAIRHTRSGWPGGTVAVSVAVEVDRVRVEVRDAGSVSGDFPQLRDAFDESGGNGLRIVAGVALEWGWRARSPRRLLGAGVTVWFELARTP